MDKTVKTPARPIKKIFLFQASSYFMLFRRFLEPGTVVDSSWLFTPQYCLLSSSGVSSPANISELYLIHDILQVCLLLFDLTRITSNKDDTVKGFNN